MTDCPLLHSHLSLCLHLTISLQLFLSSSFSPSIFLFLSRSFYHSVAFHLSQSLRLSFFPSSSLTSSSYLTSRYFSYPISLYFLTLLLFSLPLLLFLYHQYSSLSLTLLSPLIINNLLSPSPSPSLPLSSILFTLPHPPLSTYHQ